MPAKSTVAVSLRLSEIQSIYLEDLACRATEKHVTNVRGKLDRMTGEMGDPRLGDLRAIDLIQVRNGLRAGGLSNRTANLHAMVVMAMLRWAEEAGLIEINPVPKLPPLPEDRRHQRFRRRALTADEARRLIEAAEADDRRLAGRGSSTGSPRIPQAPMWALLLETGARYGEAIQLAWRDVDLQTGTLALRAETTKARRPRALPIRKGLCGRLQALQDVQAEALGRDLRPTDRVLLTPSGLPWSVPSASANKVLARLLRAAGIPREDASGERVDVHALRHTFATRLAQSGAPLMHAQQLLGHASPVLTARVYSHLVTDDLRRAVERV